MSDAPVARPARVLAHHRSAASSGAHRTCVTTEESCYWTDPARYGAGPNRGSCSKYIDVPVSIASWNMITASLRTWRTRRARSLDDLEAAYRALPSTGQGHRRAAQQLNQAYAVFVSSQFQAFCRDLHSESVADLLAGIEPPSIRRVLRMGLLWERRLDRGNPTPGNIGSDFGRLGISFWKRVHASDARNIRRMAKLEQLNAWRNAIAHHDFNPSRLGRAGVLQLRTVRTWRRAVRLLAEDFDQVMRTYVESVVGSRPEIGEEIGQE